MTSAEIDALWDFNDPATTEAKFFEALLFVTDAEEQAEITTQIARTLGLRRRFEEAQSALDAINPTTTRVRVRKLLEQGRVLNSSGHKEQSIEPFRQALDLAITDPELEFYAVDAAHMLGIACEGETALAWNLKAIDMAKAANDPRAQKWQGSLLNNTGWSLHDLGRFDEAHQLFVDALAFRQQQGNEDTIRIAKWCVGRCLRSLGKLDEALQIQQDLASTGADSGFIAEELGELMLAKGQADEARLHFAEASKKLSEDPWLVANEPERLARLARLAAEG